MIEKKQRTTGETNDAYYTALVTYQLKKFYMNEEVSRVDICKEANVPANVISQFERIFCTEITKEMVITVDMANAVRLVITTMQNIGRNKGINRNKTRVHR